MKLLVVLTPARRFAVVAAGWALLFASTPGCVWPNGSWLVAAAGIALWGAASAAPLGDRPKRAAFLEWLANAIGVAGWMWWVWWVVPFGVLYIGAAMGLYVSLGGWLARRLARRVPVGLAVALGWTAAEVVRTVLIPPFGLGWFLLGHTMSDAGALTESARVGGIEGLTLLVALAGGALAELLSPRRRLLVTLPVTAAAFALAWLAAALTAPPPHEPGPHLTLIQPGSMGVHPDDLIADTLASTPATTDLVVWGETLVPFALASDEARAAVERGVRGTSWRPVDARVLDDSDRREAILRQRLFDRLPDGVAFLAGAQVYDERSGTIVPRNAAMLYDADGRRVAHASKRFLVPGAETMLGLERFRFLRELVPPFVPDFAAGEETGVLPLTTRDGRVHRLATTVCFDNAFLEVFTDPVAAGPVDLHVVLSNEAWYRDAFEHDQMLAFSRVAAIATGRSLVRATNSGITCAFGPRGEELARLTVGGRDRSVPGSLALTVPVPEAGANAVRTPYVVLRGGIRALLAALVAVLALAPAAWLRRTRSPNRGGGR